MNTSLVKLRPLRLDDAPLLYEWITNRELVNFNSPYHPVSQADHEKWIESMMRRRPDLVLFIIEEADSGVVIGSCQLLNINLIHRNAELQIRIGEQAFHGKGFGSAAVRMLTDFGFRDLNLHRIYLHVFADNFRAIHAYEKCGFQKEGLLHDAAYIDGRWVDVFVMGLIHS